MQLKIKELKMSRCLLHITKLDAFLAWLDKENIQNREGKGDYQVRQICKDGKHWNNIYSRLDMPEHYTVDRHLESLVHKFIREKGDLK